jgi:hypothetical protein
MLLPGTASALAVTVIVSLVLLVRPEAVSVALAVGALVATLRAARAAVVVVLPAASVTTALKTWLPSARPFAV